MVSSVKDDEGSQVAGGGISYHGPVGNGLVGLVFTWLILRLSCFKEISRSQHPSASDC